MAAVQLILLSALLGVSIWVGLDARLNPYRLPSALFSGSKTSSDSEVHRLRQSG